MKIVHYPDPILKKKSEEIEEINDEIKSIANEMIEEMYKADGVGLAGPQVGISKQIIIVNHTANRGDEVVYINPKILQKKGREIGEEGCLSFPGISGNVTRATWIKVNAKLLSGEEVTFEAKDFMARVLQHEIDHLNGVLFVEKIQPAEKVIVKKQLKVLEENYKG